MNFDRRSFVKTFSLAIGGLALNPKLDLNASPVKYRARKKTDRKLGVALIGLGYYSATELGPALLETENCYLAGIVTGTPSKEKQWADKYNIKPENIYNYENFDSIKDNNEIDFVYVVLPNNMHKEFTLRAAKAGKHVMCEKPMAMNSQECIDMIEGCKAENKKLGIGYRLHYDLATREIMELAKDKPYGDIQYVHAAAAFNGDKWLKNTWRQKKKYGGGSLMDMGVYSIQAARYSTGLEPIAVIGAQDLTYNFDDYKDCDQGMSFQLEFPNNITANLMASFGHSINSLHVAAREGWYRLQPFQTYRGVKGETVDDAIDYPSINQQAAHMDDFALSIQDDLPVKVPGEEGLQDMKIIEAIKKSSEVNSRVEI